MWFEKTIILNANAWNNADMCHAYYAGQKKPDTNEYIAQAFTEMKFKNKPNCEGRSQNIISSVVGGLIMTGKELEGRFLG